MKNNNKRTIKKRILKGGSSPEKEVKLELDGLDLTFISKLASTSAKLVAGAIVFGVEHLFATISSSNPKPLSKETIHETIQILNNKLNSVESFLKSQEGQQVLRELNEKLTILATEISKVAGGPLKILTTSLLDLMMETGEKFVKKGSKFGKNIVRIVPGLGDAFIVAENVGTAATAGSEGFTSFIKSVSLLSTFVASSTGNLGKITSVINDLRNTFNPILNLLTAGYHNEVAKIPIGNIRNAIKSGTQDLSKNMDRLTHTALMGLNQSTSGVKKGGTRRRIKKIRRTKKSKK